MENNKYIHWHLHSPEPFTSLFYKAGRAEHKDNKEIRENNKVKQGPGTHAFDILDFYQPRNYELGIVSLKHLYI